MPHMKNYAPMVYSANGLSLKSVRPTHLDLLFQAFGGRRAVVKKQAMARKISMNMAF